MKFRIVLHSLAVGMSVLSMVTLGSVSALAQQPGQPAPQPSEPSNTEPAQQTPGQPQPTQAPSQPAPAQPAPAPIVPEARPQPTGPTETIEGAVTNIVAYSCGRSTVATVQTESVSNATPPSMPAGSPTTTVSATGLHTIGQGCSAVLLITPGVNWAQVAQSELTDQTETAGRLAGFGIPVRVVVKSTTTTTTRDNADVSLLDLPKGSIVKVDYVIHNDVPIATNVDITWHAGQ